MHDEKSTAKQGFVESDGGFPPAFLNAIDALNDLSYFVYDLTVHCRPCIGLPMQNPKLHHKKSNVKNNGYYFGPCTRVFKLYSLPFEWHRLGFQPSWLRAQIVCKSLTKIKRIKHLAIFSLNKILYSITEIYNFVRKLS